MEGGRELIRGIHFLLTYQCTRACPHCFLWARPGSLATMNVEQVTAYLDAVAGTAVRQVFFEGGEPFLYYPTLRRAVQMASDRGLYVGVLTNGYWATGHEEALGCLGELLAAGMDAIMISTDDFHGGAEESRRATLVIQAARDLGLEPDVAPTCLEDVLFRGRAAVTLARQVPGREARHYDGPCTLEDLVHPSRVHVDPLGYLHLCQGLVMGRVGADGDLAEILVNWDVSRNPVAHLLATEGPYRLAAEYGVAVEGTFADRCHLCYEARRALFLRGLSAHLGPGQMYGVFDG